ncbi:hypothetical protein, partial [Cutibacterium modestum]|uniref:hypothetical protein n=1 Tax=Cutibacterium modestum TaxID=2559073 RepID=UPI001E63ED25
RWWDRSHHLICLYSSFGDIARAWRLGGYATHCEINTMIARCDAAGPSHTSALHPANSRWSETPRMG